jgi:hypothetical protein
MTVRPHSCRRVALLAGALLFAGTSSGFAQPVRGPVVAPPHFARLETPRPTVTPVDPYAGIAVRAEDSRPHLYYSVPLATALGLGGMVLGYGAGLTAFGCEDESAPCAHGPDDFEYTLAYTGLALGAAAGAHLGGKTPDSKGNFWATLGGAALGALPLLIARKDDDQTGAYLGGMVGATAGAALADYLVRRPR